MSDAALIAVLADVHGNRWALDAVLDDARQAGAQSFVDLGDCVAGPLDPLGTARRLMALGAITVRGNNDRAVLEGDQAPSAMFARQQLDDAALDWLARLPAIAPVDDNEILACHGSPDDDTCYLLEKVTPEGVRPRGRSEVVRLLGATTARVVLCGHTHLARLLPLRDGRMVVNPGSVGLPAYDDDQPYPHAMQSGSPHARYALLRRADHSWDVELRAIPYQWHEAAAAARAHGREDWAVSLETGLVSTR
jgi:predicted phosphodiesterase